MCYGMTMWNQNMNKKDTGIDIDTDSFIEWIKTDDIFKDIGENVETSFDISNYESERPLPKAKNKKVIDLMKGELNGKITTELVGLRAKT